MKNYLVEFIGTFFLVFVIALTGNPIAIGGILMVMVYMGGHISGAQYNPAVTFALLIRGKMTIAEAIKYMGFQILGAATAAACYYFLTAKTFAPMPDSTINPLKPLFIEIVFTFALALVVLMVATHSKTQGNSYYGLAIGFTVMAAAYAGGKISGGAYNPAVGIGPIVIDSIFGYGYAMPYLWLYIVGPLLGGTAAGVAFRIISPEEIGT